MDKISKALEKLSAKEQRVVRELLARIESDTLQGLDLVKLKGRDDVFRIRKGDIRVIYRRAKGAKFRLAIERRSEKTYKDF